MKSYIENLKWSVTEFFKSGDLVFTISNSPNQSQAIKYAKTTIDKFNLNVDTFVTTFYNRKGHTFIISHKDIQNA